jgi:hypothetical protein
MGLQRLGSLAIRGAALLHAAGWWQAATWSGLLFVVVSTPLFIVAFYVSHAGISLVHVGAFALFGNVVLGTLGHAASCSRS